MNVPSIEAIKYGRSALERQRDRMRSFAEAAMEDHKDVAAAKWLRVADVIDRDLLGGKGCVITPFDSRWLNPEFRAAMEGVELRTGETR